MTSTELENLVRIGQLKREPPAAAEVSGLLLSGEARLADAANRSLSLESRFDLSQAAGSRVRRCEVIDAGAGGPWELSDHRPILMEIDLPAA